MTSAPQAVVDLVQRYCQNREQYRHASYKEAQVRTDFIDPFFEALGWDVSNKRGAMTSFRDVVQEPNLSMRGSVKSPDYAFCLGAKQVQFYVEAKKPSVNIHEDASPAYQLRRYAWTQKLAISVLTDFEELSVYEGRHSQPKHGDSPATARVLYVTCDEYLDRWDEISGILSKHAVQRGEHERYATQVRGKRGTQEVDAAFLAEIENWRSLLARNLALRNPGLSTRALNYAVQKIIDRIIFLRMAEDRGIEPYEQLRGDAAGEGVYGRLLQRFRNADAKYNSGLFHFEHEAGHAEEHDTITPALALDDKTLREIITSLYYPTCPYEFSVLGADILGHVYEQFLGSVISLTAGHRAKIEQKPEVRKAGGVYYTPTYIVDYIVQQTVGQLVEGRSPGQVERLRILDPACGSGSFLLGAYQYLLDWHLTWYAEHPAQQRPEIYRDERNQPRLTIETKKRILTNNIYGVDIDSQAVEVTKLSLLLKVLEGENEASLGAQQLALFGGQRALPDLAANIQCGNSLIGSDYLEQAALGGAFMDEDEMYRVNPFDWEDAFPEVFNAHGGFDAVIGNPPYVEFKRLDDRTKSALLSAGYRTTRGKYDVFVAFVEKAIDLASPSGYIAFIMPSMFTKRDYGAPLRELIMEKAPPAKVVDFGDFQVFAGATNYVGVYVFVKGNTPKRFSCWMLSGSGRNRTPEAVSEALSSHADMETFLSFDVDGTVLGGPAWALIPADKAYLQAKAQNNRLSVRLGDLTEAVWQGIASGKDAVFYMSTAQANSQSLESQFLLPLLRGRDVAAWAIEPEEPYVVVYPYDQDGTVVPEAVLRQQAPNIYRHLADHRADLRGRGYFDKSSKKWYELWCPREPARFRGRKLVCAELAPSNRFSLDTEGHAFNTKVYGVLIDPAHRIQDTYLLGILNSSFLTFLYTLGAPPKAGGYFAYKTGFLEQLPIRTIDFDDPIDVARHDRMVSLVERMLELHKQLAAASLPQQKTLLQRQIDATDRQIDRLVYELYGLTEEEIKIVEGA